MQVGEPTYSKFQPSASFAPFRTSSSCSAWGLRISRAAEIHRAGGRDAGDRWPCVGRCIEDGTSSEVDEEGTAGP